MKSGLLLILLFFGYSAFSHPAPNSILLVDVSKTAVGVELHFPVAELRLVLPFENDSEVGQMRGIFGEYVKSHLQFTSNSGMPWLLAIQKMEFQQSGNKAVGITKDLVIFLKLVPPADTDTRHFVIHYDAIMHKVLNHRALVYIRQDWETGKVDATDEEIGVIGINTETMKIVPMAVNLEDGSSWNGFNAMVKLGIRHIAEGTDHLLFLLTLLLTAPLFFQDGRWNVRKDIKGSLVKILKISLSFTIGHSLTLILASFGLFKVPSQPVEIIIALSIIVTAVHALKPIFPNRETIVTAAFGLIHGLAFSTVLSDMHLDTKQLAISLLGFNIGIEVMQIIVIFLVMPWLIFLSRYKIYPGLKNILSVVAIVMAFSWMVERFVGADIFVSKYLALVAANSILFVVLLFILSAWCLVFLRADQSGDNHTA